ncbi:MAG: tRNA (guanosine(46)-N7)-methyltransferase TrmB [Lysobacterales bacterium]
MRQVRSFVLRGGRLTEGQKRALDEWWPVYGIGPEPAELDLEALFGNRQAVILEIGFGKGESTWQMAREQPEQNFLGVEVHLPGVGHLLLKLAEHGLQNVRIACTDAVLFLRERLADASLAGVRLYFPDPWPKKRHYKRRIVQAGFMDLLARKLAGGGILHMATDWEPYAQHMLEALAANVCFENLSVTGDYCPRPEWRPVTRYEKRGQKLGHPVHDLIFRRQ